MDRFWHLTKSLLLVKGVVTSKGKPCLDHNILYKNKKFSDHRVLEIKPTAIPHSISKADSSSADRFTRDIFNPKQGTVSIKPNRDQLGAGSESLDTGTGVQKTEAQKHSLNHTLPTNTSPADGT